jgi:hypothetical protein
MCGSSAVPKTRNQFHSKKWILTQYVRIATG